jgi:choline transport protein
MPLLPSKFDLRKWGLAVNIISMIFLIVFLVACFFPLQPNPTPNTMNWSILLYIVAVIGSLVYFVLSARHKYASPVEYVQKLE